MAIAAAYLKETAMAKAAKAIILVASAYLEGEGS